MYSFNDDAFTNVFFLLFVRLHTVVTVIEVGLKCLCVSPLSSNIPAVMKLLYITARTKSISRLLHAGVLYPKVLPQRKMKL